MSILAQLALAAAPFTVALFAGVTTPPVPVNTTVGGNCCCPACTCPNCTCCTDCGGCCGSGCCGGGSCCGK